MFPGTNETLLRTAMAPVADFGVFPGKVSQFPGKFPGKVSQTFGKFPLVTWRGCAGEVPELVSSQPKS